MTAVVLLSKIFFPPHPKAGEENLNCNDNSIVKKIHTCRINYDYWAKKIEKLKAEGGVLSVRQWSDKPYRSPQEVIVDIPAETVGIQKLKIEYGKHKFIPYVDSGWINLTDLAKNDGLTAEDFMDWVKPVFEKEKSDILDFAIIHFTGFRY